MNKTLILGGYGNFGKRIAAALVKAGLPVIIAGRDKQKADALKHSLNSQLAETACIDVSHELDAALSELTPTVVINTCGPFQTSNYDVAACCIRHGVHYIDLADGRDFVTGIDALNAEAKQQHVTVISGASTVPGLSSAVVEHFQDEFSEIDQMTYGISPGQQAERGLATTKGILTYVGKPLKSFQSHKKTVYGWQDIYRQDYPELGKRWMANCDIPDLDLLPQRYSINTIRFSAGLELSMLHLGLWGISWLMRAGLPVNLANVATPLLNISNWFYRFGSAHGGMHVILSGKGRSGEPHRRTWFIIARDGYGPYIPTIPVIILAKKLVQGENIPHGAMPCVGMVSLDAYLAALDAYPISTYTQ